MVGSAAAPPQFGANYLTRESLFGGAEEVIPVSFQFPAAREPAALEICSQHF